MRPKGTQVARSQKAARMRPARRRLATIGPAVALSFAVCIGMAHAGDDPPPREKICIKQIPLFYQACVTPPPAKP